ncbi:Glucan 1,3-beta-glucosidase [Drechslerella dactyloides]|uniref:glucan endo-1,3-beta-D-glucosidase n=1 Tax=Drechslerella dactyloides TaxID=74499 RepID=A0AAD6NHB7_DREDA|nr:Glucan 1,3-beta-glucosidase [Drechslerella dactyloides]
MFLSKIFSLGLKGALMLSIIGVGAVPVPEPSDAPAAPVGTQVYKAPPFNTDIPVPVVTAPADSTFPFNGTIVARDGSVKQLAPHERSLSNPEIRARANVYRPGVSYFAGFNMGTYTSSGGCMSQGDWVNALRKVKSFNNPSFKFSVVKVFTTSQCSCLSNALNAARQVGGIKIWAGIWTTPYATFQSDKNEVANQVRGPNANLIAGVSVGSEELFRGTLSASTLAGYIWDVKGMVQNSYGKTNIPVGTSDGIGALLNGANQAVLDASDVMMVTDYPFYGGTNINSALSAFKHDWWALGAKMNGRPLVVGETGWPTGGQTVGQAVPTTSTAGQYFRQIACWMRTTRKPFFWFQGIDEPWKTGAAAETQFGVSSYGGNQKFSMTCS